MAAVSHEGDFVIDPTAGSFSVLRAAQLPRLRFEPRGLRVKEDKRAIFRAASEAQKAADFVLQAPAKSEEAAA